MKRLPAFGLIVLMAAACDDATGPGELSDPSAISGEVAQLAAAVETPAFKGFELLGAKFPAVGAAGALLRATEPVSRLADGKPSARIVASARELQSLVPVFSRMSPQDTVLPDSAVGTWVWDTVNDRYVKDPGRPAPLNTARFIIYAIDPITDLPIEPLDEVGYADLTDNQPAGPSYSLGLTVKDSAGTTTYLDYDVTVTPSVSAFTATASGYVANGASGVAERRLDFSAAFTASGTEVSGSASADATITLNVLAIRVEVHDDVTFSSNAAIFSRDFLFHRPGETIRVQGSITITEVAPSQYSITVDVVVRVNGRVFATIQGTDDGITATGPNGRQLTPDEAEALGALLEAGDRAWDVIEDLLDPVEEITPG
ncbi:MAG: hypothetical protein ACREMR_07715 [Gemmatimonadales bacterium]